VNVAGKEGGTPQRPALFFDTPQEFRAWLERHHGTGSELWMGLNKKHVTPRGLEWAAAVEEALCFGWIDSQVQRLDEDAVRQRWTPRRPTSTWSAVNLALVPRLVVEGRMTPAGLAAYERRRPDRQAVYAYEQGELAFAPELEALLLADPRASAWFAAAPASYRKICVNWVMSAKQATTRERRMGELVEDCAAGRLIRTQRYGTPRAWVSRRT
jgi:uncharacterized protein YdeI (YjbR/CyaY-like superfamily)